MRVKIPPHKKRNVKDILATHPHTVRDVAMGGSVVPFAKLHGSPDFQVGRLVRGIRGGRPMIASAIDTANRDFSRGWKSDAKPTLNV